MFKHTMLASLGLLAMSATAFAAGPFGISQGATLESLEALQEVQPNMFLVQPTNPHPSFEQYLVLHTESQGVCKVIAIDSLTTNRFGVTLKQEFTELEQIFSERYGDKYQKSDEILTGSLWSSPKNYMTSLQKEERILAASWDPSTGYETTNGITAISITAKANTLNRANIILVYDFENFEDCEKEIRGNQNRVF